MIKIIVDSEETKKELQAESEFVHYELDSVEKCSTLAHLYMLPDEYWIIENESTD